MKLAIAALMLTNALAIGIAFHEARACMIASEQPVPYPMPPQPQAPPPCNTQPEGCREH